MPLSRIFNVANMSFNAIRGNKILAKISEFTVYTKHKPCMIRMHHLIKAPYALFRYNSTPFPSENIFLDSGHLYKIN